MLALMLFKVDLNIISIIGIVLLIGIVKKNAIMMIDFALEAERQDNKTPTTPSSKPACCASAHSHDHMAAMLGALPLAWNGHRIGTAPSLGITIVGA